MPVAAAGVAVCLVVPLGATAEDVVASAAVTGAGSSSIRSALATPSGGPASTAIAAGVHWGTVRRSGNARDSLGGRASCKFCKICSKLSDFGGEVGVLTLKSLEVPNFETISTGPT